MADLAWQCNDFKDTDKLFEVTKEGLEDVSTGDWLILLMRILMMEYLDVCCSDGKGHAAGDPPGIYAPGHPIILYFSLKYAYYGIFGGNPCTFEECSPVMTILGLLLAAALALALGPPRGHDGPEA